jgi:hypothetical protein
MEIHYAKGKLNENVAPLPFFYFRPNVSTLSSNDAFASNKPNPVP